MSELSDLHRRLDIPEGYYRTPSTNDVKDRYPQCRYEPPARKLGPLERDAAISTLVSLNILPPQPSVDDIIERMCARLGELSGYDYDGPRNFDGSVPDIKPRPKAKSPILDAARAAVLADPFTPILKLVDRTGISQTTICKARQQLVAEGKLPYRADVVARKSIQEESA